VAVISAVLGARAYSLVYGGLASSVVRASWLVGWGWKEWRPRVHFRFGDLAFFMRFGLFQMGDRVTNYIWNNVDYMLAGRILGSGPLGIYRLAFETVIRPLGTVNPILNRVAYPVFSKSQDDNVRLRAGVLEMNRLIAVLVFPMMAGLCAVAPLAVHVVFGPKWAGAAWIIQILSPYGALRALLNPASLVVVAKGRVEKALYLNLALAIALSIGYRIAVPHGLDVMAWTGLILLTIVMVVSWNGLFRSTIGLEASSYLRALAGPTVFSVAMGITVYAAGRLLAPVIPIPAVRLVALILLGAAVYATMLLVFDRAYVNRLRGYLARPRN
jgi:O-antigen/teichoic acid export membrane protein